MAGAGALETALGRLRIAAEAAAPGATVWLALRPEKLRMSRERPAGEVNALAGTVFEIGYRGDISIYKVRLADGSPMKVSLANTGAGGAPLFSSDDRVWLSWPPEAGVVLTR